MDGENVLSRRERKKLNCRYTIVRAARELITEKGLDVSVEEIAGRADISGPTFYNYFPTKSELYYAIYTEAVEDLREYAETELKGETCAAARLQRLLSGVVRDFAKYRYLDLYIAGEIARRREESEGEEELTEMFLRVIRSGIQSGEFRQELDAEKYARLISGIILSSSFYKCGEADCAGMLDILLEGMSRT